jgi:hypothetical protein
VQATCTTVELKVNKVQEFLTAILHRGLRNCFFFIRSFTFSNFYLDFYFPFHSGLLFPFFLWTFIFPFLFVILFNRGHSSWILPSFLDVTCSLGNPRSLKKFMNWQFLANLLTLLAWSIGKVSFTHHYTKQIITFQKINSLIFIDISIKTH